MKFVNLVKEYKNNNGWNFTQKTKDAVEQKMELLGYSRKINETQFFRCIYCVHDNTKNNECCQWHPLHLCQYDHIIPFSQILNNPETYYSNQLEMKNGNLKFKDLQKAKNAESPDIGELFFLSYKPNLYFKAIYNDVDNLHIICAGHNQNKKNQLNYLGICWCQLYGDNYKKLNLQTQAATAFAQCFY